MSAQEALSYGLIDEIIQPDEGKLQNLLLPPSSVTTVTPMVDDQYSFDKLVCAST
jgi:hypothetical protein